MNAYDWIVHKALSFVDAGILMVSVSTICVIVIFALEAYRFGFAQSSLGAIWKGDPSARRDLLSYSLDVTGVLRIAGHVCTLGIGYMIGLGLKSAFNLNLTGLIANPVIQVSLFLFLKSFFDYWMHRFMHMSPVLWEIHKYHHSAEEMNVVTAHRESIMVAPFASIFLAIPFGIMGIPTHTFVIAAVIIEFHALLVHSRLAFDLGWFERILISPRAHRLHHARGLSLGTRNFGFFLSIWDHAFGTYERAPKEDFRIGLENQGQVYNYEPWWREMLHSLHATGQQALVMFRQIKVPGAVRSNGEMGP